MYLQVYWDEENALQVQPNKQYSSMCLINPDKNCPSIPFDSLKPQNKMKYSMKMSSTNNKPENCQFVIKMEKHCDESLGHMSKLSKFLFYGLININSTNAIKEISIVDD